MELERTRTTARPGCGSVRWSPGEIAVPDAKCGVPGVWSFLTCADCRLVYLAETLADPTQGYPSTCSQHRRPGAVRLDRRWSLTRDLRGTSLALLGYRGLPPLVLPRPLAKVALALPQVRIRAAYGQLLVPPAREGSTLLDIGCGNGRLLAIMRTLGWRVHGIEPDERSADIARQSSGARIDSELEEQLYPPGYFDVVTMNHVAGVRPGRCSPRGEHSPRS